VLRRILRHFFQVSVLVARGGLGLAVLLQCLGQIQLRVCLSGIGGDSALPSVDSFS
jgi:hypothetical protein